MIYHEIDGVHIAEVSINDFKIIMCDKVKKSATTGNYANAGFFASYAENGQKFTLPVGHLVCDFDASSPYVKKYCGERGNFEGNTKFRFDSSKWAYNNQFYGKKVTTLMISGNSATIDEVASLPAGLMYAVAGIPVMRNGNDVKFATDVCSQGWDASALYATWHIFVGLKQDCKTVYVMAWKTTTKNMITSAEAYKKFKSLGFYNVIKLDGGGSFIYRADTAALHTTENRRINTIITMGETSGLEEKNPYPAPTVTLTKSGMWKLANKWLQWQLTFLGFPCEVDGYFGSGTEKQVMEFQKSRGLTTDGSVGPATRAALMK